MIRSVVVGLALSVAACAPMQAPESTGQLDDVDASRPMSVCDRACRNMDALGCPEGRAKTCVTACKIADRLEGADVSCWATAATRDDLMDCDGVRCVP